MQTSSSQGSTNTTHRLDVLPTVGNDAIDVLLNDHQTIKKLLVQLTDATDPASRKSVLERLKAVLTIHNATEENLVYPALRVVAKHMVEAEQLYVQTAEADVHIFELDMMLRGQLDEADFPDKARSVRKAIESHIESEEQHAFKHLREEAPPDVAQTLTAEVRKFRHALNFEPPSPASAQV